jgi:hypothetical protein
MFVLKGDYAGPVVSHTIDAGGNVLMAEQIEVSPRLRRR